MHSMNHTAGKTMSARGRPQALSNQKNALGQGLDPRMLVKYEPVVQQLLNDCRFEKEPLCNPENCARLIIQIQLFMDQKLGYKTNPEEHFMTKIPAKLFRDFSINGSVQFILSTAFTFRHQVQQTDPSALRRFELLSEKQKTHASELCLLLKRKLIESKFWIIPHIYIWDEVETQLRENLIHIIKKHDAILTTDIKQCTHIIINSPARDHKDVENYAREIYKEGNRSFAHWWYFPDSWNFWTSSLGTPEHELSSYQNPPGGIWMVGYDWLTDMVEYNEWLCELDYEIFDLPQALYKAISQHPQEKALKSSWLTSEKRKTSRRKLRHSSVIPYHESDTISDVPESNLQIETTASFDFPSQTNKAVPTNLQVTTPTAPDTLVPQQVSTDLNTPITTTLEETFTPHENSDQISDSSMTRKRSFQEDLNGEIRETEKVMRRTNSEIVVTQGSTMPSSRKENPSDDTPINLPNTQNQKHTEGAYFEGAYFKPQPPKVTVGAVPLPTGGISLGALSDPQSYFFVSPANKISDDKINFQKGEERADWSDDKKEESINTEKDDDNNSTLSNQNQRYSFDARFNTSQAMEHPREIEPNVYQYSPTKNLSFTSELMNQSRVSLLNLSSNNPVHASSLSPIPLGTPPDRPPPPSVTNIPSSTSNQGSREPQPNNTSLQENEPEIVLPTCSSWFDMNSVHNIERDQLSALFTGSGASLAEMESTYKNIRNTIVSTYRRNPKQYLSSTDCRKILDGDAAIILRLFGFLDYWGIINFQADPSTILNISFKGKDFCLSDTLYSDPDTQNTTSSQAKNTNPTATSSHSPKSSFSKPPVPPQKGGGPWKCASCGKICLYTYYVIRPGGTTGISMGVLDKCVWCVKCFGNGNYPSNLTQHQFLKVDIPIAEVNSIDSEWSSNELEKLIEGIEMYREDWEAVAKHVGTGKSPHQCISYFISLPIEEPFSSSSKHDEGSNPAVPFQDIANPLLAQLAFLASIVDPNVAAVAAKAALDSIMQTTNQSADSMTSSQKLFNDSELFQRPYDMHPFSTQANEPTSSDPIPEGFISKVDLQVACSAATAAAAVRSRELALIEEEEIRKILPKLIDLRLQKIDIKRQRYKALENQISHGRDVLEKKYESLILEWNETLETLNPKPQPST